MEVLNDSNVGFLSEHNAVGRLCRDYGCSPRYVVHQSELAERVAAGQIAQLAIHNRAFGFFARVFYSDLLVLKHVNLAVINNVKLVTDLTLLDDACTFLEVFKCHFPTEVR